MAKKINSIEVIELGGHCYSVAFLKSVSEGQAVRSCSDKNQVRKAWKIAHGLTVPDYIKAENEDKPKRKRTTKKKEDKPS